MSITTQITFEHNNHDLKRFKERIQKNIQKSGAECKVLEAKNEFETCVVVLETDCNFGNKKAMKSGFQKLFPKFLVVDACNIGDQGLQRKSILNKNEMFYETILANSSRPKSCVTSAVCIPMADGLHFTRPAREIQAYHREKNNEQRRRQYDDLFENAKELHREKCKAYSRKKKEEKLLFFRREQEKNPHYRLCLQIKWSRLLEGGCQNSELCRAKLCQLTHAPIVDLSDIPVVHGLTHQYHMDLEWPNRIKSPIEANFQNFQAWPCYDDPTHGQCNCLWRPVLTCPQKTLSESVLPYFMFCRDPRCTHSSTHPGCWVACVRGEAEWICFDNCFVRPCSRPTHSRPPFDIRVFNFLSYYRSHSSWIDKAGIDSTQILGQSAISSPEALKLRHYLANNVVTNSFYEFEDSRFSEFGTCSPLFVCNVCAGSPMTRNQFEDHVKMASHNEKWSLIRTLEMWKKSELYSVTATTLWMETCFSVALFHDCHMFWNFRNCNSRNLTRYWMRREGGYGSDEEDSSEEEVDKRGTYPLSSYPTEGAHENNPLNILVVEVANALLCQLNEEEEKKEEKKEGKADEKQEERTGEILEPSLWTTEKRAELAMQIFRAPGCLKDDPARLEVDKSSPLLSPLSVWLSCGSVSLAEIKTGRAKEKHDLMDGFARWYGRYFPLSRGKSTVTKQMFAAAKTEQIARNYCDGDPKILMLRDKYSEQYDDILKMVVVDAMAMTKALEVECVKHPLSGGKYPRVYPPGFTKDFFWLGLEGWGKPFGEREGGLWEWEEGGGGGMGGRISWEMGGAAMATSSIGMSLRTFAQLDQFQDRDHDMQRMQWKDLPSISEAVLDICHGKKIFFAKHPIETHSYKPAPVSRQPGYFDYARHDNRTSNSKEAGTSVLAPSHPITTFETQRKLVQQMDILSGKVRALLVSPSSFSLRSSSSIYSTRRFYAPMAQCLKQRRQCGSTHWTSQTVL